MTDILYGILMRSEVSKRTCDCPHIYFLLLFHLIYSVLFSHALHESSSPWRKHKRPDCKCIVVKVLGASLVINMDHFGMYLMFQTKLLTESPRACESSLFFSCCYLHGKFESLRVTFCRSSKESKATSHV